MLMTVPVRPATGRTRPNPRHRWLYAGLAAVLAVLAAVLPTALPTAAAASPLAPATSAVTGAQLEPKPTIVLVHGAFADASGWDDVSHRLQKDGYTVYAVANPLRGIEPDAEWLRVFLSTIEGPIVLVGHSYGGAVITNAATGNPQVKALVYVAGYAPAEGETLAEINELGGGHSYVPENLVIRPYPDAPPGDGDGYLNPDKFRFVFCADLSRRTASTMAAAQRPLAGAAFVTPSGEPGWQTIPSWYLIASDDNTIPPEAQRIMADRMGADTREIASSHVAMISHPKAVTTLVLEAATS